MNIKKFIKEFFGRNEAGKKAPFVIISKEPSVIEYENIEVALSELEKDPDIPKHKLEKLRAEIESLKSKGKIKISNGEIVD